MQMVFNTLFPVFSLLILGALLRRCSVTSKEFLSQADKLIYYVFFPAMLFWKIGGTSSTHSGEGTLILIGVGLTVFGWILSLAAIRWAKVPAFQAGSFSQGCFRFNTYIGMAVCLNALGDQGVRLFSLLIGFAIPIINVLSVGTLIWFSGDEVPWEKRWKMMFRAIITNPLILGCVAGLLYGRMFTGFPTVLENTLKLTSMAALPLALLSIGGTLTFEALGKNFKTSLLATTIKQIILPVSGWFILCQLSITGLPLQTMMIFLAMPISATIHVLSSQLKSDTGLASALIVFSTIFSLVSLSVALVLPSGS